MQLEKFYELQKKFENRRFVDYHYWTNKVLYLSSYLGNILSIIFCYFFVNTIATEAAALHFPPGSSITTIVSIFVVLFLTMFEFTKRFTFANTVTTLLTSKKITNQFILGSSFVFLLVAGTFYLSLSGAQTFADKGEKIESNIDSIIQTNSETLSAYYLGEITKLEDRIEYVYKGAKERKKASLTSDEISQIKDWESQINNLRKEKDTKIDVLKSELLEKANKQQQKSNTSTLAFLLISAFIELLILIGVGFKQFYDFKSFAEKKEILEGSINYQKLITNLELLAIVYSKGKVKVNSTLPSTTQFKELVNSTGKKYTYSNIKDFFVLLNYLKITQVVGVNRVTKVNYDSAIEMLQSYFNIDNE
jgi:hypothetical protein